MATKISTFNQLKLLAGFADEDDRTITVENPRSNLTKADFNNLTTASQNVIIGDKYGATFTRYKSARYVQGTTTTITF